MKKVILILSVCVLVILTNTTVVAQTATDTTTNTETLSDDSLLKMDIFTFCKALGIPSEYNARYKSIILPLCEAGVIIIPAKTNPYITGTTDEDICYVYIGNTVQNEILKRNILKNRHLIVNGKLSTKNAKLWRVVK